MIQIDKEELERVAAELSLSTADEVLESSIGTIEEMRDQLDDLVVEPDERDSIGSITDDEYNAFLEVYDKPRREAETGNLAGLTFAVKDCIAVEDLRMTCGSTDFSYVPGEDAAVVERLLAEGAALIGKTNMEAFALGPTGERSDFGIVVNPVAEGRIPGGSSSGSGAAVAAELVDFALGTDTAGSVRLPAACCGVVGVKPTHGLVPKHGFIDLTPWADTIGPLARDVETAARVLETMAGHDHRDPSSSHVDIGSLSTGLTDIDDLDVTVGIVDSFLDASDDDVARSIEDVGEALAADAGVSRRWISLDLTEIANAYPFLVNDFAWVIRQMGNVRGQGTGYDEGLRAAFAEFTSEHDFSEYASARVLPAAYLDEATDGQSYVALRRRSIEFRRQIDDLFDDVDVLLTPTTRVLPPEYDSIGVYHDSLDVTGNTVPFNVAGTPAVSVPVTTIDGLPVSAQVVAPHFEDDLALRIARHIEASADY